MRYFVLLVALFSGCDSGSDDVLEESGSDASVSSESDGAAPPVCVPEEEAWSSSVRGVVDTWCGQCHGETVQFGAPYGLLDYPELLKPNARSAGVRPVDRLVTRLQEGTMPPAGQPRPEAVDLAAILDWATCGENAGEAPDGPNPGGFDANRPILTDPGEPPEGSTFFEWRVDGFELGPDQLDHYECFTFEAPVTEERFITRVETIVDDVRVLHHMVLIPGDMGRAPGEHGRCTGSGLTLAYAWAPGQGALHFVEGGMRLHPGERYTMQIHYNNGGGFRDVLDRSGLRVYHGPTVGPEVGLLTLGPVGFRVEPRARATVAGYCEVPAPMRLVASFPHMHEGGVGFDTDLLRADGAEESVISLSGWDFETQFIYDVGVDVAPGDVLTTRCHFANESDKAMNFGPGTGDEMCFNFVYVTPPPDERVCNQETPPGMEGYEPGACAPREAGNIGPPLVSGAYVLSEPPTVNGGPEPSGLFVLDGLRIHAETAELSFGTLDLDASRLEAYGVVEFEDGQMALDVLYDVEIVLGEQRIDRDQHVSVAGRVDFQGSEVNFAPECGQSPAEAVRFQNDDDGLTLVIEATQAGISFIQVLRFQAVGL